MSILKVKLPKCNKIIGLTKKHSLFLSRKSLLTIYKSFVRPNLDYVDIIYNKTLNESFKRKIEMVQHNAALIITGAFKGTMRNKELGLESLVDRRWIRKLFFQKIILGLLPSYLKDYLIPFDNLITYLTWSSSFFPQCAEAWGNHSEALTNIDSINTFKSRILNFVRPRENLVFPVHDINSVKLLTRLRLDFSHLNEHKFQHDFNDIIHPMCSCDKEPELTLH